MTILESILLGGMQGITEFLPISSSGHLIILEKIFGLNVSMLKGFDVSLHIGTLAAILAYFWRDVWGLVKAFFRPFILKFDRKDEYTKLIAFIVVGTLPAILVGGLLGDYVDSVFRDAKVVGIVLAVTGLLFLYAEHVGKKSEKKDLNIWRAFLIGLLQMFAIIPGVSRSGATISGGLFNNMDRSKAARFSFLLGIPAIFGAGFLTALRTIKSGGFEIGSSGPMICGFVASFIVGLLAVSVLMKYLKKHSLNVFVAYRLVVGIAVILFV